MKQLSLWFAFFSCAALASILPESCTKKNGALDPQSLSKTSSLAVERTSTITPLANPAIAYIGSVTSGQTKSSGLMVMNTDGSNQTFLASGGGIPAWSPNGTSVLFSTTINNQSGLALADISLVAGKPTASKLRLVPIHSPYPPNGGAKWSPLGDSIVFTTEYDNNIYAVSIADGGSRTKYTSSKGFMPYDPDWSPDGTKIAFDEWNDAWTQSSLKLVDITTGAITTVVPFGPYLINTPEWSHDGNRIAYEAGGTIYTVALSSNAISKVTSGSYPATWSFNDSKLAFVGGRTASVMTYTFSNGATQTLATGTWPDCRRVDGGW